MPRSCGQYGAGSSAGQRGQEAAFVLEGLGGNQARLACRAVLHADRGPLDGLPIQVLQALETAAGQEVGLDGPKTPLLAGFAVRVANRVTEELEAVAGGEGGHFRHDHRLVAAAPQTRQVGVVDDALPGREPQNINASCRKHFIAKRLKTR